MEIESGDKDKKLFYDNAVTKFAEGDAEYLTILYSDIKRDIFIFAYSIIGDYYLAEDVMQDTFIQIQTKAYTYQKGTNAKAWILTITRNLSFKALKQYKKEVSLEVTGEIPADYVNKIDSTIDLASLLSTLSEEEKQILILHDGSGLKHREIAGIMNLKDDNVRKMYSRLIKKVCLKLKGCD